MTNSNGTCIFIKGKVFNLPWRDQVKNVGIEDFSSIFLLENNNGSGRYIISSHPVF